MSNIKINKKKNIHYQKLKKVMDDLYLENEIFTKAGTTYLVKDYCLKLNNILDSLEEHSLTFKQFVADINADNEIMKIEHELYEKYISMIQIYKVITLSKYNYDKKNLFENTYVMSMKLLLLSFKSLEL